jgi:hypothetical protein
MIVGGCYVRTLSNQSALKNRLTAWHYQNQYENKELHFPCLRYVTILIVIRIIDPIATTRASHSFNGCNHQGAEIPAVAIGISACLTSTSMRCMLYQQ